MFHRFRSPHRLAAGLLAAGLALAGSSRATADTVNLTFDKTTGTSSVSVWSTAAGNQTTTPGPYYWHQSGPLNSQFPANTIGFCVELTQLINTGSTYAYDIKTVDQQAGAANAAQFTKLWGAHFDAAWAAAGFAGSVASTAFQLAVWELVYDGPNSLDLSGGNFKVPGANLTNTGTAAGLAKSWLDGLATTAATAFTTNFPGQKLVWLTSPTAQDQLMMVPAGAAPPNPVPAPAGLLLGLFGVGTCALARVRRAV